MSYDPLAMSRFVPIALLVFWLTLNFLTLTRFPTVFIDEAENANHAWNLAHAGVCRFSLYDEVYPRTLAFLREAWPPVIRPFFVYPLALWVKAMGFSLFKARAFNVMAGALALAFLYVVGVRLGGARRGLYAALLAGSSFLFLYSAHTIRPEMLLAVLAIASYGLWVKAVEDQLLWAFVLAGFLCGMAPGIHTNGLALTPVFWVLWLFIGKVHGKYAWFAGWLTGTILFSVSADWERFLPGQQALFFKEFTTPPLFQESGNFFRVFLLERERYAGGWIFHQWPSAAALRAVHLLQCLVWLAAVFWGAARGTERRSISAATTALLLVVVYALLIGQKAANYLTVLIPFFSLALAGVLIDIGPRQSKRAFVVMGFIAIWICAGAAQTARASLYQPHWNRLQSRLQAIIPAGARVAGPQEFWLALPDRDYRDVGVVLWHRMLLGESNVWKAFDRWMPEYVMVDQPLAKRLATYARLPGAPRMLEPTHLFPWPHEILLMAATGAAYGDAVLLLRFRPEPSHPR